VYEGQPIGVNVDVTFDIGPEYYNFCDVRFIGEPVLRDRIFPPVQNVTYITNTVNVTNIYVQNNIVYNYGPDYTVVNRYSSRPIQRLAIERQAAGNLTTAVKSGTLTKVQGNKLLVAAPQKLAKAAPAAKPPAVKAKVAQPKIERGWKNVPNKSELEQKIKAEDPKKVPPPTRAAAREAGSPAPGAATSPAGAERGPAAAPSPRGGRAGRVVPGATQAPSLGGSPAPVERGKGRPGPRSRPGATAMPQEGAERVAPSPIEGGRPGGRARPGMTVPPAGPREGLSPAPLERGRGRGQGGEQSTRPGAAGGPAGVERTTPPSALEGAPSQQQQQQRRQPPRRPVEQQGPRQSEPPPNSPQGQDERIKFGTPAPRAPMGATEQGQPRGGPPAGLRQQVAPQAGAGQADEARIQRERMQAAPGQQPPTQRQQQPQQQQRQQGGAPASADHGQGRAQPEGGQRRQPRQTPPPGQQ